MTRIADLVSLAQSPFRCLRCGQQMGIARHGKYRVIPDTCAECRRADVEAARVRGRESMRKEGRK